MRHRNTKCKYEFYLISFFLLPEELSSFSAGLMAMISLGFYFWMKKFFIFET